MRELLEQIEKEESSFCIAAGTGAKCGVGPVNGMFGSKEQNVVTAQEPCTEDAFCTGRLGSGVQDLECYPK